MQEVGLPFRGNSEIMGPISIPWLIKYWHLRDLFKGPPLWNINRAPKHLGVGTLIHFLNFASLPSYICSWSVMVTEDSARIEVNNRSSQQVEFQDSRRPPALQYAPSIHSPPQSLHHSASFAGTSSLVGSGSGTEYGIPTSNIYFHRGYQRWLTSSMLRTTSKIYQTSLKAYCWIVKEFVGIHASIPGPRDHQTGYCWCRHRKQWHC